MIANHPEREQIRLENVLSALGHHWRVLRDSGVIWQRPQGRENMISLRREDLDARFPGLLDTLLKVMVQAG
ncbi:MAG: hypothetical protein E7H01_08135 [Klebsiella pneumoniae]|nr:hypothetical protein [Klebsiella pneumoniae]